MVILSSGWVGKLLGNLICKDKTSKSNMSGTRLGSYKNGADTPGQTGLHVYRFKLFKLINWEEIFEEGGKLKWRWLGEKENPGKLFFVEYIILNIWSCTLMKNDDIGTMWHQNTICTYWRGRVWLTSICKGLDEVRKSALLCRIFLSMKKTMKI